MLDIYRATLLPIILPMLARSVSAGFPSPADDFIEDEIDLSRLLVSNRPATFAFANGVYLLQFKRLLPMSRYLNVYRQKII